MARRFLTVFRQNAQKCCHHEVMAYNQALTWSPSPALVLTHSLMKQGEFAHARIILEAHLAEGDQAVGFGPWDTFVSRSLRAIAISKLGELQAAKDEQMDLVRLLTERASLISDGGIFVLRGLAGTQAALSELEEAAGTWRRIADIQMALVGENDILTLRARANLADVLRRDGKYQEALAIDSEVLARMDPSQVEHRFLLDAKRNVYLDLLALKRRKEAAKIMSEIIDGANDLVDGDELKQHFHRRRWQVRIASFLSRRGMVARQVPDGFVDDWMVDLPT